MTTIKEASAGTLALAVAVIAAGLSVFQLYTAGMGVLTPMLQDAIHIVLILILIFLTMPLRRGSRLCRLLDYLLIAASAAACLYVILTYQDLIDRIGDPNRADLIFGWLMILVLLEAARRTSGLTMSLLALIFLLYAKFGDYLPGVLYHKPYSWSRIVSTIYLGTDGIFGATLGVAATFVILFILFGSFLEASGGGKIFLDLAFSIAGRYRGGPAKVAVIGSGLMGMISGSPVANVATVGTFTIPLMKRMGYHPRIAAAIEAVASSGGAIMPPVMGAGAFVMSEMTGIPYSKIIVAAAIPAILYYLALFWAVDFEAARINLKGLPKEELPRFKDVLARSLSLLIPVGVLIYFMVWAQLSPMRSAFWGIVAIILSGFTLNRREFRLKQFWGALVDGAKGARTVSSCCAVAGIIVGVVSLTGLGLQFSNLVLELAHGLVPIALVLTMIASLILGMGLPPTAAYIVLATIGAPALTKLGLPPLIAHLFIFYFSCFAPITPPVALAAYAAAGISGANPTLTGYTAARLGLTAFLVPYMFVYGPAMLAIGSLWEVSLSLAMGIVGTFCLAASVIGWLSKNLYFWERLIFFAASLCLILPGLVTDLIGLALMGLGILSVNKIRRGQAMAA